jgi:hypothetical protein
MSGFSPITYVLSQDYTDESIKGTSGVLAGKNCTIESATYEDGVNTIVFKWTAYDGTTRRTTIQIKDGLSVADYSIIARVEQLPTDLTEENRAMIYVEEEDAFYLWDGYKWSSVLEETAPISNEDIDALF